MTEGPPKAPPEVLARLPQQFGGPTPEPESEPEPARENGDAPSSLIAGLREQRRRIAQRKMVLLELPLWQGKLAARYGHLDERTYDRLAKAQTDNFAAGLGANADALINGCVELVARRTDDEAWGPIFEDQGPVRYEKRLADALHLELEGESARAVVYALFGGRIEGAAALNTHANQYLQWLQGSAPEVAEEFSGESTATDR